MGRMSVATVSSPEFVNITSVSPFASKCEIKVFYLGQNRNGSFIDKAVAEEMAQTLPGCPIVGYFSENKDDFRDHGEQVIIDGDGVKFKCQTVPYGFVAPDAKVWFKEFEDTDEFGNKTLRTYLMTEGYLWTQQYEEARRVISEGRPQSMELDTETLKGYWSTDNNRGVDFFIITDAIFSKLCILGEDVEPCFEGSTISAPDVSSTFSKDDNFTKTLHTMIQELKELTFSLKDKGGSSMPENENLEVQNAEEPAAAPAVEENEAGGEAAAPESNENFSNEQDKVDSEVISENQNNTEEFTKKEEEDEDKKEKNEESDSESGNDETDKEDDDEEKKKASKNTLEEQYALVESELKELQDKYASLESENKELREFKLKVEDKQKDELINSFYMLSDEDKKEVIENKSKYSLDDIEKTLSVICVRKKVNFTSNDEEEVKEVPTTFNLTSAVDDSLPAWLKAVEARKNAE